MHGPLFLCYCCTTLPHLQLPLPWRSIAGAFGTRLRQQAKVLQCCMGVRCHSCVEGPCGGAAPLPVTIPVHTTASHRHVDAMSMPISAWWSHGVALWALRRANSALPSSRLQALTADVSSNLGGASCVWYATHNVRNSMRRVLSCPPQNSTLKKTLHALASSFRTPRGMDSALSRNAYSNASSLSRSKRPVTEKCLHAQAGRMVTTSHTTKQTKLRSAQHCAVHTKHPHLTHRYNAGVHHLRLTKQPA